VRAPTWETSHTEAWPVYLLKRTATARADLFRLRVHAPSGELVVMIEVQLWQSQRGNVSSKALHPANVEFAVSEQAGAPRAPVETVAVAGAHPQPVVPLTSEEAVPTGEVSLAYTPRFRTLAGLRKYVRTIGKTRDRGSWDTVWRADTPPTASAAAALTGANYLPDEISVVNADERVCVYRGKRPVGTDSKRCDDLLAWVPSAQSKDGSFDIAVHPELHAARARHAGVLSLFLAIVCEGFWSQGAICLGQSDWDWQTKVDNTTGPPPAVRDGKNLFRVMQNQNIREFQRETRDARRQEQAALMDRAPAPREHA